MIDEIKLIKHCCKVSQTFEYYSDLITYGKATNIQLFAIQVIINVLADTKIITDEEAEFLRECYYDFYD